MYKYRDRIINLGKDTGAKIILPETSNSRIEDAAKELTSMGFNILQIEDFQENVDLYLANKEISKKTDDEYYRTRPLLKLILVTYFIPIKTGKKVPIFSKYEN